MTILKQDSFESGTTSLWVAGNTGTSTEVIVTSPVKSGTYACRFNVNKDEQAVLVSTFPAIKPTTIELGFNFPAIPTSTTATPTAPAFISMIMFYDVNMNQLGNLALMYNGTNWFFQFVNRILGYPSGFYNSGNVSLSAGSWATIKVEMTFSPTAGTVNVWLNGALIISVSGQNTGGTPANAVQFGALSNFDTPISVVMDDVVITDSPTTPPTPSNLLLPLMALAAGGLVVVLVVSRRGHGGKKKSGKKYRSSF